VYLKMTGEQVAEPDRKHVAQVGWDWHGRLVWGYRAAG